jgi:hypothetical protein
MGCCFSTPEPEAQPDIQQQPKREAPTHKYTKPKWKHEKPISKARLQVGQHEPVPFLQVVVPPSSTTACPCDVAQGRSSPGHVNRKQLHIANYPAGPCS